MGFFDSLLSGIGKVANIVAPLITGTVASQAVAGVGQALTTTQAASTQAVDLIKQTGAQVQAIATQVGVPTTTAAGAVVTGAAAGAVGMANVRTETVIQRISRTTGLVLSTVTKPGSPFLMNSEVRALRRVSKMISKAHGKIPRKSAKISEKVITEAVGDRLQQLNLAQCLVNGNGKCP